MAMRGLDGPRVIDAAICQVCGGSMFTTTGNRKGVFLTVVDGDRHRREALCMDCFTDGILWAAVRAREESR